MFHRALVACLVCATFLTGCASQGGGVSDRLDRANSAVLSGGSGPRIQEWLDDHPVIRSTAYTVGFTVLAAGVVALVVLVLMNNDKNP